MTGYIYKIWNDINDKIYIGKTISSLDKRFNEHCADSKRIRNENRPLYQAMNKYGTNCFHIELIEECEEERLSEREIYWIEYYHSYSNGYNATFGGDGKILYNHDEMITLYQQGLTSKDIAEQLGCHVDTVYLIINRAGLDTHINAIKKNCKKVKAVLQDGSEYSFESTQDAAEWLRENNYTTAKDIRGIMTNISRVAKGKEHRKSYLGIKWIYI